MVLAAVGEALSEHAGPHAVVGRMGGEEFLVAAVVLDPGNGRFGQRLCGAVTALPHGVSASVGTASIRREVVMSGDAVSVITALIGRADAAMYAAKRRGGNQSQHH